MAMLVHFRFMFPDMEDGIDGVADYERDILTLDLPGEALTFSLSHIRHVLNKPYHIEKPVEGWKTEFTDQEKAKLRPIAETLAMLDGNAFFGTIIHGKEWYEQYLPEAHSIYESNGGDAGGAGASSFAKND